jgi:hypothetical protein
MEEYEGVKFTARVVPGEIPEECANRLLKRDGELRHYLSPVSNEGNLSVLCGHGFVIKGAGARLTLLKREDLSFVIGLNEKEFLVDAIGTRPSSKRSFPTLPFPLWNTAPSGSHMQFQHRHAKVKQ